MANNITYLYIPANQEKYYSDINNLDADCIIFDLEDSVAKVDKDIARRILQKYLLEENNSQKRIFVRLNNIKEIINEDLNLINNVSNKISGIFIPKISHSEEIDEIVSNLNNENLEIIPMIESPKALLNIQTIVSNVYVETIAIGEVDLSNELDMNYDSIPKYFSSIRLYLNIVTSSFNKLPPIGPVWLNVNDIDGYKKHLKELKELGYKSVQLIHPSQIELANKILSIDNEDIEWAKNILNIAKKKGKTTFKDPSGNMIDEAVIVRAQRILDNK